MKANRTISNSYLKGLLPINLQLFSDAGAAGAAGGTGDGAGAAGAAAAGDGAGTGNGDNNSGEAGKAGTENNNGTDDLESKIDKLVQTKVDKITAQLGKEKAALQQKLTKLEREKLTTDEVKALELQDKENAIAEKERAIAEKENKLYAIQAIKEIGLDDGSKNSLALVDFVMDSEQSKIDEKVTNFNNLVKAMVQAQVEKTFKDNGRVPNGSGKAQDDSKGENAIAKKLGEDRAAKNKQSNDILKMYIGG